MDAALQWENNNSPAEDEPQQELQETMVMKTTSTGKNFCTELCVQHKHNVGTWCAHALERHKAGQESAPLLTNYGKRYKCKRSHATALQTAITPPKNAQNTRDHSS